jgi:hypothetical protein
MHECTDHVEVIWIFERKYVYMNQNEIQKVVKELEKSINWIGVCYNQEDAVFIEVGKAKNLISKLKSLMIQN